jgi:hypothetical protein
MAIDHCTASDRYRERACSQAWVTIAETVRILSQALERGQALEMTISGGDVPDLPNYVPGVGWCERGHHDGSYEVVIRVKPPRICPKCGKNHGIPQSV